MVTPTPGPWRVAAGEIYGAGDESPIGVVYRAEGWCTGESVETEDQANARLIEAAPDLLNGCNALRGLIQLIRGRDDLPADLRAALQDNHRMAEAEAAITKATGAAP